MLHTIRQIVDDDEKWRGILRGLNADLLAPDVTGRQVEDYISAQAGMDLGKVFEQYLTHDEDPRARVPPRRHDALLPLGQRRARLRHAGAGRGLARQHGPASPTEAWQTAVLPLRYPEDFAVDPNFYVIPRRAD